MTFEDATNKGALFGEIIDKQFAYFLSLESIRKRCYAVYDEIEKGKSDFFEVHKDKLKPLVDYLLEIIRKDYGTWLKVPPHGRWRSFQIVKNGEKRDLVEEHVNSWLSQGVSQIECARRVIDLFVVSVLLDAGAGSKWKYIDNKTGLELKRTEGLGIASLRMYEDGYFSSDPENPFRVDSKKLKLVDTNLIMKGMQVTNDNPLIGAENRALLLQRLGCVIEADNKYFVSTSGSVKRPGNMIDFLMKGSDNGRVSVCSLWEVISIGLLDVWPKAGAELSGKSLGDAWVCKLLEKKGVSCDGVSPSGIVPFHKLSMWLTWSLTEVLSRVGSIEVLDLAMLTGLPEYRNGGLLVDMGVIGFKPDFENKFKGKVVVQGEDNTPLYEVDSEIIVQWRCLTIVVLDKLHDIMTETLGVDKNTFTLSMLLEGGTWKAGRIVAAKMRQKTGDPPFGIISSGTIF